MRLEKGADGRIKRIEYRGRYLRASRTGGHGTANSGGSEQAVREILRVGTSAGGARAKALIAWNPETNEVRSGQSPAESGFEYWLMKFDGVTNNRDKELVDPEGFGAIEYAYSRMAADAGISMMAGSLFEENGPIEKGGSQGNR